MIARTVGRYAAGALLVAVLAVIGVGVRTFVVAQSDSRRPADVILVLGAAQYDGRPSPIYQARLDHAAELFRSDVAAHVLTIGAGQSGDRTTEGAAGRDYLIADGLPESAVTAVEEGNDTLVSLRAARGVLLEHGWTSVVVVTDRWHSHRAALMARDLGLTVQTSPVTTGPSVADGVAPKYWARETLGTLFYLLTGGSSGLGASVGV